MSKPVIFQSASFLKTLRGSLNLNDTCSIIQGDDSPQSSATDAPRGSIYLRTGASGGQAYIKLDNGSSTNWEEIGSGGASGINYVTNPGGEVTADGWTAYADAAAASPADGTGGSPTTTITRSTSSPLRGTASLLITKDAANRQGEGVAFDFTIDRADLAKPIVVSFDYEGSANFLENSGTVASPSDIMVWIYDVTNARLVQPLLLGMDGSGRFVSAFQADATSQSYRLILHIATTNANAWTYKFDNIVVGPAFKTADTTITDWVAFTPTGSWSTNTTYTGFFRRIGDSVECQVEINTSGAPTAAGLTVNLPSGLTLDTTKFLSGSAADIPIGQAWSVDGGNQYAGNVEFNNTTSVRVSFDNPDDANNRDATSQVSNTAPFTFGAGDAVYMWFRLPIVGWGTGKVSAIAADSNRPVIASYVASGSTANASFADGGTEIIDFDTRTIDTHAAVTTGAAWSFRCPVSGKYLVSARFHTGGESLTANDSFSLNLYKNTVEYVNRWDFREAEATVSNINTTLHGTEVLDLVAGDTLDVRFLSAGAGAVSVSTGNRHTAIYIAKIDSGSPLAALSESVNARASGNPASASVGNPVIWPTSDFDTHAAYNVSTGLYTVPVSGKYRVSGYVESANATITLNIAKDGTTDVAGGVTDANGEGLFHGIVSANAGQTLSLEPSGTLDATAGHIAFERIGA